MSIHRYCPCGECPLDRALWTCTDPETGYDRAVRLGRYGTANAGQAYAERLHADGEMASARRLASLPNPTRMQRQIVSDCVASARRYRQRARWLSGRDGGR